MNMKAMRRLGAALMACVLAVPLVLAQQTESVQIKRATELRDAPGEGARSLAPLPLQSSVTRLGPRQGPWIEVRNAQGTHGWIHMFDIGSTPPAQGGNAATGALRGITSFFGKGSAQALAPSSATSTIGIRGLGAEDLANAQPNLDAVAKAEAMRQDAAQARQFGNAATLVAQAVAPLPVPAPATRAPAAGPARSGNNSFNANEGSAR